MFILFGFDSSAGELVFVAVTSFFTEIRMISLQHFFEDLIIFRDKEVVL
jgi:hypothetical protein